MQLQPTVDVARRYAMDPPHHVADVAHELKALSLGTFVVMNRDFEETAVISDHRAQPSINDSEISSLLKVAVQKKLLKDSVRAHLVYRVPNYCV